MSPYSITEVMRTKDIMARDEFSRYFHNSYHLTEAHGVSKENSYFDIEDYEVHEAVFYLVAVKCQVQHMW